MVNENQHLEFDGENVRAAIMDQTDNFQKLALAYSRDQPLSEPVKWDMSTLSVRDRSTVQ